MERVRSASLRRRQIDRMLRGVHYLRTIAVPQRGWIAEVRGVIGMRAAQLAARLGVTQSAVSQFERAEADGSITLRTLAKVAQGLDCRLVYAFVPEQSFEDLVQDRARLVAQEMVGAVGHTMALEDQQLGQDEQQETIEELAETLARTLPRELWDTSR